MTSRVNRGGDSGTDTVGSTDIVQMPWYLGDGEDTLAPEDSRAPQATPPMFDSRTERPTVRSYIAEPPSLELRGPRPSPATPDSASRRRFSPEATQRDGAAFVNMRALLADEAAPVTVPIVTSVRPIGAKRSLGWAIIFGLATSVAAAAWWLSGL